MSKSGTRKKNSKKGSRSSVATKKEEEEEEEEEERGTGQKKNGRLGDPRNGGVAAGQGRARPGRGEEHVGARGGSAAGQRHAGAARRPRRRRHPPGDAQRPGPTRPTPQSGNPISPFKQLEKGPKKSTLIDLDQVRGYLGEIEFIEY